MGSAARICIIAPEFVGPFPNGGVGTACYWEAQVLGQAGYDVTVLYTGATVKESAVYWAEHFAQVAPFHYVDVFAWAATAAPSELHVSDTPACAESYVADLVYGWLRSQPAFDVVLAQEFLGHAGRAVQAHHAGRALSTSHVATTMHSCRQWVFEGMRQLPSGRHDLVVDFLERETARQADLLIAPSAHMAEWARQHWSLGDAQVVPYCFDPSEARSREVVEHQGPFNHLVFFGRLETRKGLHLFCEAVASGRLPGLQRVTFLGKHSTVDGMPSADFIPKMCGGLPGVQVEMLTTLGSLEAQAWLASQTGMLVVAPSLVDNLPYAIIELYSRRIPFVSTRIGGIPEIVGGANSHLLAEPTVDGLIARLSRVLSEGRLTTDYRAGYDVADANRAHVAVVDGLLTRPRRGVVSMPAAFAVVVARATSQAEVDGARARIASADPVAQAGTWRAFDEWVRAADRLPAVIVDLDAEPLDGFFTAMLGAVAGADARVATSYYRCGDAVVQPLGRSLESGWGANVFGGPCLAASPAAVDLLRAACGEGPSLWRMYAAVATRGGGVELIPEALYNVPSGWAPDVGFDEVYGVSTAYAASTPADLDLAWMLRTARASSFGGAAVAGDEAGRAEYDRLAGVPDDVLSRLAGLDELAERDAYRTQFGQIQSRVVPLLQEWELSRPRIAIYGAGLHTRVLLGLVPQLGQHVAGFIDRRPMPSFLGKPCVRVDQFDPRQFDVVVYSSREHEEEMYQSLAHVDVDHVRLYGAPVPLVPRYDVSRVARRFGVPRPDRTQVLAMSKPPDWVKGFISGEDATFLTELVDAVKPTLVLELGVAAGASSAAILYALDRLPNPEGRTLRSADISPRCYFDPSHPVGDAVQTMYPAHRATWELWTTHNARRLAELSTGADLAFIDGNHGHPWPVLDLLQLAPSLKPGSWVVLHDTQLPVLYPKWPNWGPNFLFSGWPFNKVHDHGTAPNIAAVQLPLDLTALVPMALALLDRRWEFAPAQDDLQLAPEFEAVERAIWGRLRKNN